jgi:hypothetical protein
MEEFIDCMEKVEEESLTYEEDLENTAKEEAGESERIEDWEFMNFFDDELEKLYS